MKTSNKFTLFRMISAPILFVIYFFPIWLKNAFHTDSPLAWKISWALVVVLLIFSELTDYWDGAYARKHGEVSDFGKMFDPFADVFLHLSMFTCFVFDKFMPTLAYILIFYREFAQNFLRMIAAKNGIAIAARKGGKVKTVFYVISCFVALALEGFRRFGLEELTGFPRCENPQLVNALLGFLSHSRKQSRAIPIFSFIFSATFFLLST